GDGSGHLLLRLHQLLPHVDDDLIQHLLGVFRRGDQIIDVRLQKRCETIEDTHAQRSSRYAANSRRCDASASVMLSYAARNSSKSRWDSSSASVRTMA